ncbi:MAG: RluA family pseudouridine synthase [Candidatus Omnitrophica bacterium]|nr:RluA family pseudouridine synthase [Candidatus Omnitrophota bacterium]
MLHEFIILEENSGIRLDKFLSENLSDLSRSKINKLIDNGSVKVNGTIKKSSFKLKSGQTIRVNINEQSLILEPFKKEINIIYEDNYIIVIDKPAPLVVHPPHIGYNSTLVNALIYLDKKLSSINPLRPGVVHRLDKETSGLMVLAKDNICHENIINQFKKRTVKKVYVAVVWGQVKKDKLSVNLPLARDKKNRLKMAVSFLGAKEAYTEIEVVKRFKDKTLLSIKPRTGRMHQIRVHLKFLGFPIVGDKKYGIKDNYIELFLHSKELCFMHPVKGNLLKFETPLPERFVEILKEK